MGTLHEAAGGDEGVTRLAAAWHARMLADEVAGHPFQHGVKPDHTERLAAYWSEAWDGEPRYSRDYGDESSVVRIHSGNGVHEDMDLRSIECFDRALEDTGLATDERLRSALHDYFAWTTTTTMGAYPRSPDDVPEGLAVPHWSWDGLVGGAS